MKLLIIIALASVVMTGCVSMQLPEDYCNRMCQVELREGERQRIVSYGRTYSEHKSQEWRDAMAASRQQAARWAANDFSRRVTTAGPDLAAYGPVGAAGYMQVAQCRRDVTRAVKDVQQRERFDRMCYDLLPVQHREKFYANDRRVPRYDPPVIIVVPVKTPQSTPSNLECTECRLPGSLQ